MQCISVNADCSELIAQFISCALSAHECNTAALTSCNGTNYSELVARFDQENVVIHCCYRCGAWIAGMFDSILQVCFDDSVNAAVKSCTEQQTLTIARNLFHQVTDDWQEAHVSHLICFVKYCDFNFTEIASATVDQIFETTRCCNNNICTASK